MSEIKNTSFLYGDLGWATRHAARYKKQIKKKLHGTREQRVAKFKLLYSGHMNDVYGFADAGYQISSPRFTARRTPKRHCLYSHRVRGVNNYFGLSKYRVAHFTRLGLIRGLRRF